MLCYLLSRLATALSGTSTEERPIHVKKMIAGVITAVLMSAGLLTGAQGAANAGPCPTYGPCAPVIAKHAIKDVKKAVQHKGKLSPKRAQTLLQQVRLAKRYHLIKPRMAKYLIKQIHKDTRPVRHKKRHKRR
jgi:hypothetical protein